MEQNKKNRVVMFCMENKDCEDLERRKIYQVLPDDKASKEGYVRVIDESGEDYLYPESYFISVQLPNVPGVDVETLDTKKKERKCF